MTAAAIDFPRGLTGPRDAPFDFSFSGLKTAVARWIEARQRAGEPVPVADVAASFQEAVADVLTAKAVRACREHGVDHLVLGGGVAANSRLRALAEERCAAAGIVLRVPSPRLCTDNGAMVAALGSRLVAAGVAPSEPDLGADSSLPDRRRLPLTESGGAGFLRSQHPQTSAVGAPATRVTTTTAVPVARAAQLPGQRLGLDRRAALLHRHPADPAGAQQRPQLLQVERQHLVDPVRAHPRAAGRGVRGQVGDRRVDQGRRRVGGDQRHQAGADHRRVGLVQPRRAPGRPAPGPGSASAVSSRTPPPRTSVARRQVGRHRAAPQQRLDDRAAVGDPLRLDAARHPVVVQPGRHLHDRRGTRRQQRGHRRTTAATSGRGRAAAGRRPAARGRGPRPAHPATPPPAASRDEVDDVRRPPRGRRSASPSASALAAVSSRATGSRSTASTRAPARARATVSVPAAQPRSATGRAPPASSRAGPAGGQRRAAGLLEGVGGEEQHGRRRHRRPAGPAPAAAPCSHAGPASVGADLGAQPGHAGQHVASRRRAARPARATAAAPSAVRSRRSAAACRRVGRSARHSLAHRAVHPTGGPG